MAIEVALTAAAFTGFWQLDVDLKARSPWSQAIDATVRGDGVRQWVQIRMR